MGKFLHLNSNLLEIILFQFMAQKKLAYCLKDLIMKLINQIYQLKKYVFFTDQEQHTKQDFK